MAEDEELIEEFEDSEDEEVFDEEEARKKMPKLELIQQTDKSDTAMKDALKGMERTFVRLQRTAKNVTNVVKIDGKPIKSYGEPEVVSLNGYRYYVPRGVRVKIPLAIAEILEQKEACEIKAFELAREKLQFHSND